MKLAMWSGPRNLSTAMMYAFAARGDCAVEDEPFYGAYLAATGIDHPMRWEVIGSQPSDPMDVAADILGPIPDGKSIHSFLIQICTHCGSISYCSLSFQ